jgi:hypothetical protein
VDTSFPQPFTQDITALERDCQQKLRNGRPITERQEFAKTLRRSDVSLLCSDAQSGSEFRKRHSVTDEICR